MSAAVDEAIRSSRLVAILRAADPSRLLPGAEVLVSAGVRTLELPLTSPQVLDAIAETSKALQGRAFVGAGTVRTVEDARLAIEAGASFLVAPTLDLDVVAYAVEHDVTVLPGTLTPTEIDQAMRAGAGFVKLFPAVASSPSFLKQLLVPMPEAAVVPTGGVGLSDAPLWLAAGAVALGVGSPLTGDSLDSEDWDGLRSRASQWLEVVS